MTNLVLPVKTAVVEQWNHGARRVETVKVAIEHRDDRAAQVQPGYQGNNETMFVRLPRYNSNGALYWEDIRLPHQGTINPGCWDSSGTEFIACDADNPGGEVKGLILGQGTFDVKAIRDFGVAFYMSGEVKDDQGNSKFEDFWFQRPHENTKPTTETVY